jgi:hypothetical protein
VQSQVTWRCKRAILVVMACVLCSTQDDPTDEDVIPKWLLRALKVERGSTTISVAEEAGDSRQVGKLRHFQVRLDKGLCKKCNNVRLGGLEHVVQPILEPMIVRGKRTTLDLASRQRYPQARPVKGYLPTLSETGWLLAELERGPVKTVKPPDRSFVWLAAWDCKKPGSVDSASMLHYAPSTAPVRTPEGGQVVGQFTTLAIGFAAFQAFTVDFVEAKRRHPGERVRQVRPELWFEHVSE